jgi:hypothetical protein
MGPPLFAPLLFSTVGLLGIISSMLRREDDPAHTTLPGIPRPRSAWLSWLPRGVAREGIIIEQDVREGRFQRALAVVTAFSALFSWIESFYSHYKNNFSFRIQWSPIIIGPGLVIAALAAVWSRTIARTLMPLMSLIAAINGAMGFFYHVRGVVRRPGGLKTPFYNVVYGPPVLAPLLFASAGFTGLLASLLRRAK